MKTLLWVAWMTMGILVALLVLAGCDPPSRDHQDVLDVRGQILCSINGKAFVYDMGNYRIVTRARSADKLCERMIDAESL